MLYEADGTFKQGYEYVFNAAGLVARKYWLNAAGDRIFDPPSPNKSYEYDSAGRVVREGHLDSNDVEYFWLEYEYDSNGNMFKETWRKSDGSSPRFYLYEYDANGKKIKETLTTDTGYVKVRTF